MESKSYSRYRNINSIIHRIDPITKLLCFILLSITIFIAQNIETLAIVISFFLIISLLAKLKIKTYFKITIMLVPIYVMMILIYFIATQDILFTLYLSTQILMRIFLFILSAAIYTSTTKEMEIANSLE